MPDGIGEDTGRGRHAGEELQGAHDFRRILRKLDSVLDRMVAWFRGYFGEEAEVRVHATFIGAVDR
jgi:hypothetical protein